MIGQHLLAALRRTRAGRTCPGCARTWRGKAPACRRCFLSLPAAVREAYHQAVLRRHEDPAALVVARQAVLAAIAERQAGDATTTGKDRTP